MVEPVGVGPLLPLGAVAGVQLPVGVGHGLLQGCPLLYEALHDPFDLPHPCHLFFHLLVGAGGAVAGYDVLRLQVQYAFEALDPLVGVSRGVSAPG
ncbi:hypothetical protein DRO38_06610, partial [Candidatus Bathyarchaeota archaeon]